MMDEQDSIKVQKAIQKKIGQIVQGSFKDLNKYNNIKS